jgi:tRNA nucleotidyltransferase (CCA-adding enzyme)
MERPPLEVPTPVSHLIATLVEAGHETLLVGGSIRDLLSGMPVGDFDATTAARPDQVLSLFPRAVPIGLQHGTVMIPTESGPVDVTTFRGGGGLEIDLSHRDFTVNAMAYDPAAGQLFDPFGGQAHLSDRKLRAVGSARERFAEDPLRALRAARLVATLGFEVDGEIEEAMGAVGTALAHVARERVRAELSGLLLGDHAGPALALLRRTGLEADLAPGANADAARLVPALPRQLELRLAAWLQGAKAAAILRRHRFGRRRSERVLHLLDLQPVEAQVHLGREAAVRRLVRRAGEEDLAVAIEWRRIQLERVAPDAEASARLDALQHALARVRAAGTLALQRQDLAIDGREVMTLLGCEPGPSVGRALDYLTERVIEDPACNTPDALRAILAGWWRVEGG